MKKSYDYSKVYQALKELRRLITKEELKAFRNYAEKRKDVFALMYLRKYLPKLHSSMLELTKDFPKLIQQSASRFVLRVDEASRCSNCGRLFVSIGGTFCTRSCGVTLARKDPEFLKNVQKTCLEKYGVSNVSKLKSIKDKKKATTRRNHGVDSPQQSKSIRAKTQATCSSLYGASSPLGNKEVRDKGKATLMRERGVDHNMKDPAVQAKKQATFDERYGGHPMYDQDVLDGMVARHLAKHGVHYPGQREEVKVIRRQKSMERWGFPHHAQVPAILKRMQAGLYRTKTVVIQGKSVQLQGYEPQVAKAYLETFPDSKFVESLESFPYDALTKRGDLRVYSPDFEMKSGREHFLMEVKCPFTLIKDWNINLKKFKAANEYAKQHGKVCVLAVHHPRIGTFAVRNPNRDKALGLLKHFS